MSNEVSTKELLETIKRIEQQLEEIERRRAERILREDGWPRPISWTLNFFATVVTKLFPNWDCDFLIGLCEKHCIPQHREEPTDLYLTALTTMLIALFAMAFYYLVVL